MGISPFGVPTAIPGDPLSCHQRNFCRNSTGAASGNSTEIFFKSLSKAFLGDPLEIPIKASAVISRVVLPIISLEIPTAILLLVPPRILAVVLTGVLLVVPLRISQRAPPEMPAEVPPQITVGVELKLLE